MLIAQAPQPTADVADVDSQPFGHLGWGQQHLWLAG